MLHKSMVDKLIDMCERHAPEIAENWYLSLQNNPRTSACRNIPKENLIRHAVELYRSIDDMYLSDDCFRAVGQNMDVNGLTDTFFARGVPLEQAQYAMTLLRRHIWLYADQQLIFNPSAMDMALAVASINRILLVFDYATYYLIKNYMAMAARGSGSHPAGKQDK